MQTLTFHKSSEDLVREKRMKKILDKALTVLAFLFIVGSMALGASLGPLP